MTTSKYDYITHLRINQFVNSYGDGSTNDQSSFTSLESRIMGRDIDLLGKFYKVTSIPDGNFYYNGGFVLGSETYHCFKNPSNHPFNRPAPTLKTIFPEVKKYNGISNVFWHNPDDGKMGILYREALSHGDTNGSIIRFALSDDGFNSISPVPSSQFAVNAPSIYSALNYDYRNCTGGRLPNGRVFSVWTAATEAGSYGDPIRVYSDNIDEIDQNDITWTVSSFTVSPDALDFHGDVIAYPASVGGNDTSGLIFFGYSPVDGICCYTSTDNGDTLTEHLSIVETNIAVPSVSEIHVCRAGTLDKWFMFIRNSGSNTYGAMSVSDDLLTWSEPVLTPLLLGSTPPAIFYESGSLWAVGFNRRNNSTDIDFKNSLKIAKGDVDEVFSSGGLSGWENWQDVCYLPHWCTGYFHHVKVENRNYGIFTTENTSGSTGSQESHITMISCDPVSTASVKDLNKIIPGINMFPQGAGFLDWRVDTSIATGSTRKSVMPRLTVGRSGTGTGGTISRRTAIIGKGTYGMRIQRDDSDSATNAIVLCINFSMIESLPFRDKRNGYCTISFHARCGAGFSSTDRFFNVRCRQQSTGSEQIITNDAGTYDTGDTTVQSSNTGVYLNDYWNKYEVSIGRFASDMTQFCVQLYWNPTGTATDDYVDIEMLKIESGQTATPCQLERLSSVNIDGDTFYQKLEDIEISTVKQYISYGCLMNRIPNVSATSGTVSSITDRGFHIVSGTTETVDITIDANL